MDTEVSLPDVDAVLLLLLLLPDFRGATTGGGNSMVFPDSMSPADKQEGEGW